MKFPLKTKKGRKIHYEYQTLEELSENLNIPIDRLILLIVNNQSEFHNYTISSADGIDHYNVQFVKYLLHE